ncbi:hypothetical protein BH11PLA2_BH11PLA2_07530 [soil metagenome]
MKPGALCVVKHYAECLLFCFVFAAVVTWIWGESRSWFMKFGAAVFIFNVFMEWRYQKKNTTSQS